MRGGGHRARARATAGPGAQTAAASLLALTNKRVVSPRLPWTIGPQPIRHSDGCNGPNHAVRRHFRCVSWIIDIIHEILVGMPRAAEQAADSRTGASGVVRRVPRRPWHPQALGAHAEGLSPGLRRDRRPYRRRRGPVRDAGERHHDRHHATAFAQYAETHEAASIQRCGRPGTCCVPSSTPRS